MYSVGQKVKIISDGRKSRLIHFIQVGTFATITQVHECSVTVMGKHSKSDKEIRQGVKLEDIEPLVTSDYSDIKDKILSR